MLEKQSKRRPENSTDLLRSAIVDKVPGSFIDERAEALFDKLTPCTKCRSFCRVQVVVTGSGLFRVGCTIHNVWQPKAHKTLAEAVEAWNERDKKE